MTTLLQVNLGDLRIGTLVWLANGSMFFAFDENYLNNFERPVLSQSFFRPSGELITETKAEKCLR
jgi:hypothetical protein